MAADSFLDSGLENRCFKRFLNAAFVQVVALSDLGILSYSWEGDNEAYEVNTIWFAARIPC